MTLMALSQQEPRSMPPDLEHLGNLLVVYGINFLGAIVVALIGWWAASFAERATRRALMRLAYMDPTAGAFLSSFVYYAVLVVALAIILQMIGVQATSLVAILGAASLAIGLALQGTLSNVAAGVMLLIFRPFRLGDSIEVAGKSGTVKNLNLFMTELATVENVQVFIPNGQVWGGALSNFSTYETRHISMSFPVALDKDVETILAKLRAQLEHDGRVLKIPPPSVRTSNLMKKAVEISIEAWTKPDDVVAVRADLVRSLLTTVQVSGASVEAQEQTRRLSRDRRGKRSPAEGQERG
jgi:small conductance mechanosensitive channel